MKISQRELTVFLKNHGAKHAKKFTMHPYRVCEKQERIETVLNGQVETANTAEPGDYIVTGLIGEQYVVKPEVFTKRYEIVGGGLAKAVGEGYAIQWTGSEFTFTAPWDDTETMICLPGDYLMSPNEDFTGVYRIEQTQFLNTYKFTEA